MPDTIAFQPRSVAGQAPFPDALKVPISWKGNAASPFKRVATLHDLVEPLLGVGLGGALARNQTDYFYVTRKEHVGHRHGMFYHSNHPSTPKQPRYVWEPRPDVGRGVYFGWLTDQARAELDSAGDDHEAEDEFQAAISAWAREQANAKA